MMRLLTMVLWLLLIIGLFAYGSSLYLIRSSCYNQTIARETHQEISYKHGICVPTIELDKESKKLALKTNFTLMYILPMLFFLCVISSFKTRAIRLKALDNKE